MMFYVYALEPHMSHRGDHMMNQWPISMTAKKNSIKLEVKSLDPNQSSALAQAPPAFKQPPI